MFFPYSLLTVGLEEEVKLNVLLGVPGMLRRWDDSQKFLSDNPHLVCKETAKCLVLSCIDYDIDEVGQSIDHHHHHDDSPVAVCDDVVTNSEAAHSNEDTAGI